VPCMWKEPDGRMGKGRKERYARYWCWQKRLRSRGCEPRRARRLFKIDNQISALDSERSAMQDLMRQANLQVLDLATAWQNGTVNQKQELAKGLFPDGLAFSDEKKFFEPANTEIRDMQLKWFRTSWQEKLMI